MNATSTLFVGVAFAIFRRKDFIFEVLFLKEIDF